MAMQAPANAPLVCHGHSRPINHLEYSADGHFLVAAGRDVTLEVAVGRSGQDGTGVAEREARALVRREVALGPPPGEVDELVEIQWQGGDDASPLAVVDGRAIG